MGYSFAVIATSKPYNKGDEIDNLCEDFKLGKTLHKESEHDLDESMHFNPDEDFYDILFLPDSTLIFLSNPPKERLFNLPSASVDGSTGFFLIEETSMTMVAKYCENGKILLNFVEFNLEIDQMDNRGLDIEFEDGFDLCNKLIDRIIGQPFFELSPDMITFRFRFKDNKTEIFS